MSPKRRLPENVNPASLRVFSTGHASNLEREAAELEAEVERYRVRLEASKERERAALRANGRLQQNWEIMRAARDHWRERALAAERGERERAARWEQALEADKYEGGDA